jgi:hypothetical protein
MVEGALHFLGNMQKLTMKPGDKLVIQTDMCVSYEMALRLKYQVCDAFKCEPEDVLILSEGLKLGVISKAA